MCECTEWICVEAFINPCSEGVELDIIPGYSGDMTGKAWFNGTVKSFGIEVTEGERIIIPTEILNENYSHEMRLYDEEGELINCYRVKTYLDTNSGEFTPTPIIVGGLGGGVFTGNETDTQSFAGLSGYTLLTVEMAGQSYTSDFWTQNNTTITWKTDTVFTGTIVLTWANS